MKKANSKFLDLAKRQAFDHELLLTCYHEAGHTLCALFSLLKVDSVRVASLKKIKDKTYYRIDGDTSYYTISELDKIQDLELLNICLILELRTIYAGLVAEKMYYQDISGSNSFPMILKMCSSVDIQQSSIIINKYKLGIPGKERLSFKKKIIKDIEKIMNIHWDAIKIIAHALYKRKKISYESIRYLLCKNSKYKFIWKRKFKLMNIIHNSKIIKESEAKEIIKSDIVLNNSEIKLSL